MPATLVLLLVLCATAPCIAAHAQTPTQPAVITAPTLVSGPSPFAEGCDGEESDDASFPGTAVEPRLAVDPLDPRHLVAVWQQDRWATGGARGVLTAVSRDGGESWTPSMAPFSRCTGGTPENGGDYARASDPWVAFAANGDVYQTALANLFYTDRPRRTSAILVSRSSDGGLTWSAPATLARDVGRFFNDKESITTDPRDPLTAYVVWDRVATPLPPDDRAPPDGPAWFTRTTDGGATWEPARPIFSPVDAQTVGNQIAVLPDGALINLYTLYREGRDRQSRVERWSVGVIRSEDRGETWSEPVMVDGMERPAAFRPVGVPVREAPLAEIAVDGRSGAAYLAWQDGRGEARDTAAVAFTMSPDGGRTWSPVALPLRGSARERLMMPSLAVSGAGVVAVGYYLVDSGARDGSAPARYVLALCRMACADAGSWEPREVTARFDLARASNARGLFLGDYQGLLATGDGFLLLFTEVTGDDGPPASGIVFVTVPALALPALR